MVYLISIILFFVLILIALSVSSRRPEKNAANNKYIEGLEAIIDGEFDIAIKNLREAMEKEPQNTEAYLYLGDILRKKGQITSAIKIHKNLSVLPDLTKNEKRRVLESLGKDYLENSQWEKALDIYELLSKGKPGNKELCKTLLMLYEKLEKWDKAFNIAKRVYTDKKDYANYATSIASSLIGKDANRAMSLVKIGLKADVPYAYYLYGKILINEGEETKGIEYLQKSISLDPERAYLILPALEEYMFRSGEFNILEPYLKNLTTEYPENWDILNTYISILKKKGELDKVKDLLSESTSNLNLDHLEILTSIASTYTEVDKDRACEFIGDMQRLLNKTKKFKCSRCNNESKEFSWKCHNCGSFGTFNPVWS